MTKIPNKTGAGLPSIPCLIARPDLRGILIESKEKKTRFLEQTLSALQISDRAMIANRQFEEAEISRSSVVTCRALDKFTAKLPRLLKWSRGRKMLLFGGSSLADALKQQQIKFDRELMPLSEQRYLFIVGAKRNA